MAVVTKNALPTLSSTQDPNQVTGLTAGEALDYYSTVYVKSDGKVWLTNGTALTAPARYRGVTPGKHAAGASNVTVYFGGVTVNYGSGLTPGADYYVSATAGALDTAATTGGVNPVAFAVDATRVRFLPPLAV